jgi:hypothetical protein
VLKNSRPQYAEIKIQNISAATKLNEGNAQIYDGKPDVSANTVRLLVPVFYYLA